MGMPERTLSSTQIPRMEGRAFELRAGQALRLIAVEGKQVGDLTAFNLYDHREKLSIIFTTSMNDRSVRHVRRLYSGPPYFHEMLALEHDTHGVHWLGGRCNRMLYEAMGAPEHRNCHDNIREALAPYGLSEHDVLLDTFNVFMNVIYAPDGTFTFEPPVIEKGDYVDFRALMDVLVAISACPNEGELRGEINDYVAKPLLVEILEGSPR
jgi:uncharacterized protein YcgI (DUF1989 family)